jgi:hypothetical protein
LSGDWNCIALMVPLNTIDSPQRLHNAAYLVAVACAETHVQHLRYLTTLTVLEPRAGDPLKLHAALRIFHSNRG